MIFAHESDVFKYVSALNIMVISVSGVRENREISFAIGKVRERLPK